MVLCLGSGQLFNVLILIAVDNSVPSTPIPGLGRASTTPSVMLSPLQPVSLMTYNESTLIFYNITKKCTHSRDVAG
jgi:hypothetical protein